MSARAPLSYAAQDPVPYRARATPPIRLRRVLPLPLGEGRGEGDLLTALHPPRARPSNFTAHPSTRLRRVSIHPSTDRTDLTDPPAFCRTRPHWPSDVPVERACRERCADAGSKTQTRQPACPAAARGLPRRRTTRLASTHSTARPGSRHMRSVKSRFLFKLERYVLPPAPGIRLESCYRICTCETCLPILTGPAVRHISSVAKKS